MQRGRLSHALTATTTAVILAGVGVAVGASPGQDGRIQARYAEVQSEVSTSVDTNSSPPADLGGPSVTVDVPKHALVELRVRATARGDCKGGAVSCPVLNGIARLFVQDDASPGAFRYLAATNSTSFVDLSRGVEPFDPNARGAFDSGGPPLALAPTPGRHTYTVLYGSQGGDTAHFKNRSLWVTVTRPNG
jgi:hypothetical protein